MRNPLDIFRGSRTPSWRSSDLDDFFERAFGMPFSLFDEMRPSSYEWLRSDFNVDENTDHYLLTVDLPGVKKEDLKVDLAGNILTISAERKTEEQSKRQTERSYGRFLRSFTLPMSIDSDQVEANLEDGVLRIVMPKSEKSKSRPIDIQTGKSGFISKLVGSSKKEEKGQPIETTKH